MYGQGYDPMQAPPGTYGVGSPQAGQVMGGPSYGQTAASIVGGGPPPGPYGGAPGPYGAPGGYGPPMGGASYGAPPPVSMGGGAAYGDVPMGPLYGGGPPPMGSYGGPPAGYGGAPPPMGPYGGAPPGQYGAPPPGQFGPPPGQFGAPPPQGPYGGPPQGPYGGPPQGQYGGPPPGQYGAPPPGYGQPQSGYRVAPGGFSGGGQKKAILIGINYLNHTKGRLRGCINDVHAMREFLLSRGFPDQAIRVLTDDLPNPAMQPTKANIMREVIQMGRDGRPGDSLFFHFSGHGSQTVDHSGDEDDGLDETILPVDYNTAGQIVDDDLYDALVAPLPAGCKLTALMDCCHSGTGLDLPYVHNVAPPGSGYGIVKKKKKTKLKKKKKKKLYSVPTTLPGTTTAEVYLYSGCRDDQTSADTSFAGQASGAMTWAFTQALRSQPNHSLDGLLLAMRDLLNSGGPRTFTQIPQLSSGQPINASTPFSL